LSHLLKHHDITVNGSVMEFTEGMTVSELLEYLKIPAGMVAVELNREIVPRLKHSVQRISSGDEIEIVHFVGGG
jgi:sulfur carrier protein